MEKVERWAIELKNYLKALVGMSQPVKMQMTETGGGTQRRRVGLDPSKPGEPPKKVTGHLQRMIMHELDRSKGKARVGTNVVYGKFLELGTRIMRRRPWLSRGVRWLLAKTGMHR
jgi:hypothetical protein